MEADVGLEALRKSLGANGAELMAALAERPSTSGLLRHPSLALPPPSAQPSRLSADARRALASTIAHNLPRFFPPASAQSTSSADANGEAGQGGSGEGCSQPGLEHFVELPLEREKEKGMADLRERDVVVAKVASADESGVVARVLCADGPRLNRDLACLVLDVFVPVDELPSPELFHHGVLFRAEVASVLVEAGKISLRIGTAVEGGRLGPLGEEGMPGFWEAGRSLEAEETYDEALRRSGALSEPGLHERLAASLGLSTSVAQHHAQTFVGSLRDCGRFRPADFGAQLRQEQTHRLAMRSVGKGVECLKAGRHSEAQAQLDKALELEADNVEALVGRGALNANRDRLPEAVVDLEAALRLRPSHANARKYLVQVLLAKGKKHEERQKSRHDEEAVAAYRRVLEVEPGEWDAQRRLLRLHPASGHSPAKATGEDPGRRRSDEKPAEDELQERLKAFVAKTDGAADAGLLKDPQLLSSLNKYYQHYAKRKSAGGRAEERSQSPKRSRRSSSSSSTDSIECLGVEKKAGTGGAKASEPPKAQATNGSAQKAGPPTEAEARKKREAAAKLAEMQGFIAKLKNSKK